MEQIKKNIIEFFDDVLSIQRNFLQKLTNLNQEMTSFKSQIASKYQIQSDNSLFTKRVQNQYITKIERLLTDFNLDLDALINDYALMMEEHLELSDQWKDRKNDPKFKKWYEKLVQDVLQEKADFRQKVEKNCQDINNRAKELLIKLETITELNLEKREGFPEMKELLIWCSTATWEIWMRLIMGIDSE